MRSTFHGLEVGKSGIYAQQTALYTTGHNISNANTKGYSRQTANMVTSVAIPYPGMQMSKNPGQLGTGVVISDIARLRDQFLDVQYRNEVKHLGYWQARHETLSTIEMIINEPSKTGLQSVMDKFWQSWQDLAKEPEASSARAVVLERAKALIETFKAIETGLIDQQRDLNGVVEIKTAEINSITSQIRDINEQISRIEPHGYEANDLKDQRDVLIDDLSKLINVDSIQPIFFGDGRNTGMIRVMSGDVAIVDGRNTAEMTVVENEETKLFDVFIGGAPINFVRGELLGILESRGQNVMGSADPGDPAIDAGGMYNVAGIIPTVLKHIETLAVEMAERLNEVHSNGLNLDDIENERTMANADKLLFFIDREIYEKTGEFRSPTDISSFMIHPDIEKSLDKIAAGKPTDNGTTYVGDGTAASDIASLKFEIIDGLPDTATFDDFLRNLIAKIGIQVTEADRLSKNSQILADQIEYKRQSVSGVSLDEEMANMIRFQHAYNASARTITAIDEILDKVINGMGIVGR